MQKIITVGLFTYYADGNKFYSCCNFAEGFFVPVEAQDIRDALALAKKAVTKAERDSLKFHGII